MNKTAAQTYLLGFFSGASFWTAYTILQFQKNGAQAFQTANPKLDIIISLAFAIATFLIAAIAIKEELII